MNRTAGRGMGIGVASVLMIVMVLAFTCFGALALVSAQANRELAERSEKFTQDYYAANSAMQQMIAQIDDQLYTGAAWLKEGESVELLQQINETQYLCTTVRAQAGSEGIYCKPIASTVITVRDESVSDQTLKLWEGNQ